MFWNAPMEGKTGHMHNNGHQTWKLSVQENETLPLFEMSTVFHSQFSRAGVVDIWDTFPDSSSSEKGSKCLIFMNTQFEINQSKCHVCKRSLLSLFNLQKLESASDPLLHYNAHNI